MNAPPVPVLTRVIHDAHDAVDVDRLLFALEASGEVGLGVELAGLVEPAPSSGKVPVAS